MVQYYLRRFTEDFWTYDTYTGLEGGVILGFKQHTMGTLAQLQSILRFGISYLNKKCVRERSNKTLRIDVMSHFSVVFGLFESGRANDQYRSTILKTETRTGPKTPTCQESR